MDVEHWNLLVCAGQCLPLPLGSRCRDRRVSDPARVANCSSSGYFHWGFGIRMNGTDRPLLMPLTRMQSQI